MTAQEAKTIKKVVGEEKAAEIKEALKKAKAKKVKKERKPKVTVDSITVDLLKDGKGYTIEELAQAIAKVKTEYKDRAKFDVLKDTTKRRVKGYLQRKGHNIKKDDNGKYTIAA